MSTKSLFSKKNIASKQPDTGRGLLDELNLPPGLISFIRKNARSLQIGLGIVVVLVVGWIFIDYYAEQQEKKGASLLALGLQQESPEQRQQMLENVIKDYSRTKAALWSTLELAHLDFKAGSFDTAAAKYQATLDTLDSDSSLLPLVRLNLAQSYEEAGRYDEAIAQYTLLKKSTGFVQEAHLALGRLYSAKEDLGQARKEYEDLLQTLEDKPDPELKSLVQAKLSSLDAGKSTASPQPEENKD